jgi:hypothetical protein
LPPSGVLRGFATEGADGPRLFLVNRGHAALGLTLPENINGQVTGLTIATEPGAVLPISTGIARPLDTTGNRVTLPPYSLTLIASVGVIQGAMRVEVTKSKNLFPSRPHLTLWYAPYARKQPRVSSEGSYTLDLTEMADKKTVVVQMDLSGTSPAAGARMRLSFDGSASQGIGFSVQLPDATQSDSPWIQLTPERTPQQLSFTFDPQINDGKLTFVLTENALAKGGNMVLQGFELVELTPKESSGSESIGSELD